MIEVPDAWREEMRRATARMQADMLKMQQQSEDVLIGMYRKAAEDVGRRIINLGDNATKVQYLRDTMDQITVRVKALSNGASVVVDKAQRSSLRQGIRAADQSIRVLPPAAQHELALVSTFAGSFNRVYHDAVLALSTDVTGIELSDKIWRIHQVTLEDMRRFMLHGMLGGMSPSQLYQQIKAFLILPNVDMRTRYWRQYFRENPPGRGVYRSAWKNVRRVLRTETNRAFRKGTAVYAKNVTWARGLKWNLSAAHPEMDICDYYASDDQGMGPGVWSVESVPDSAHPHCLCYLTVAINPVYLPETMR